MVTMTSKQLLVKRRPETRASKKRKELLTIAQQEIPEAVPYKTPQVAAKQRYSFSVVKTVEENHESICNTFNRLRSPDTIVLYFDKLEVIKKNTPRSRFKLLLRSSADDKVNPNKEDNVTKYGRKRKKKQTKRTKTKQKKKELHELSHKDENEMESGSKHDKVPNHAPKILQNKKQESEEQMQEEEVEEDEEEEEVNFVKETTRKSGEQTSENSSNEDVTENWNPDPYELMKIRKNIKGLTEKLTLLKRNSEASLEKDSIKTLTARINRLRKKEAYEENKIKFRGLTMEQERLNYYIKKTKRYISMKADKQEADYLINKVEMTLNDRVAGNFEAFVESVLTQTRDKTDASKPSR